MLNSVVNPLILGALNKSFRDVYTKFLAKTAVSQPLSNTKENAVDVFLKLMCHKSKITKTSFLGPVSFKTF